MLKHSYNPTVCIIQLTFAIVVALAITFVIVNFNTPGKVTKITPHSYFKFINNKVVQFTTYTVEYTKYGQALTINKTFDQDWEWCRECKGNHHGRPVYTISSDFSYNTPHNVDQYNDLIKTREVNVPFDELIIEFGIIILICMMILLFIFMVTDKYDIYNKLFTISVKYEDDILYNRAVFLGFSPDIVEKYLDSERLCNISFKGLLKYIRENKTIK